jgi:hypothetical protein
LTGEADYWWANSKAGLIEQAEGLFDWVMFKRAMREKFYPLHVRKDKSNEFARFEMGSLTVDEYYHNIESDRYSTLEQMYKRAAQVENIIRKEREKEKNSFTEKRKELIGQTSGAPVNFHLKKPKTFGGFQGSSSGVNPGFRGEARPAKPLLDRDGKEKELLLQEV